MARRVRTEFEEPQQERLQEKFAHLKDKMYELEADMESRITQHPIAAVGIAFGVGALAGMILSAIRHRR